MKIILCNTCPLSVLGASEQELLGPIAISYSDCEYPLETHWQPWAEDVAKRDYHPDTDPKVARIALMNITSASPDQLELARNCAQAIISGRCDIH